LLVLGRLRKLELNIQEIMDSISQYIKIEEDVLYLKGIEQGIEKGIEQGIEKGIEQGIEKGSEDTSESKSRQFVISLLTGTDFSVEKIANLASVSIEFVEKIKAEM
jgi:flagellar biosynthesis/type III secretory pathway protein FliH